MFVLSCLFPDESVCSRPGSCHSPTASAPIQAVGGGDKRGCGQERKRAWLSFHIFAFCFK